MNEMVEKIKVILTRGYTINWNKFPVSIPFFIISFITFNLSFPAGDVSTCSACFRNYKTDIHVH